MFFFFVFQPQCGSTVINRSAKIDTLFVKQDFSIFQIMASFKKVQNLEEIRRIWNLLEAGIYNIIYNVNLVLTVLNYNICTKIRNQCMVGGAPLSDVYHISNSFIWHSPDKIGH